MITRIAWGLARSATPEHRWRRVAVPVAALIFTLLTFAATSIMVLVQREEGREAGRTALAASVPAPTDVFIAPYYDYGRGEQFAVIWIDPAGSGAPVLPPGMAQLPAPGQAVVSPALDRLARQDPNIAARYPNWLVLGREGIRSEDELFAYIRMPEGRTLANDERARRVRAFGPPTGDDRFMTLGVLVPIPTVPLVVGVLALLVVPGLIALAVGVATASSTRDHRFGVLHWLGAPRRTRIALAVLETLMLALPGLILGTLIWSVLGPRLDQVPLVNHAVVHGDLGLPWWLLLALLGVCFVMTGLVTVLVTAVRDRHGTARPRPAAQRATVTRLRAAPLVVGFGVIVLGTMMRGDLGATMLLVGIVIMLVAMPLVLPGVLRAVGTTLRQQASASALLAGRSMEWDPVRTARPFAGVATLVTLVVAGSGYLAALRQIDVSRSTDSGPQAATVSWLDPRPDDVARLAHTFGTGLVAPVQVYEDDSALVVGATCEQLARYIPDAACRAAAPFELPEEAAQRRAALAGAPGMQVRLVTSKEIAASGSALVLDDTPLAVFDERTRVAAMQVLPAPNVISPLAFVLREPPTVPWIIGGILTAVIALAFGCLISMVDRLLVTRQHRRHLLNLGIVPGRLAIIEMWLFAGPYVASVTVSIAGGLAICGLIILGTDILMPWNVIGAAVGLAVVTGLVGTASVALFGARSALIART